MSMIMIKEICEKCRHMLLCFCGNEFKDCKLKNQSKDSNRVAEKTMNDTIDKACEWLQTKAKSENYSFDEIDFDSLAKDLKKALEE